MSDTPRTDAYESLCAREAVEFGKTWEPLGFARHLEKELAAANARIAELEKELHAEREARTG